jgi:hypothetical protein
MGDGVFHLGDLERIIQARFGAMKLNIEAMIA